jgi:uncharacterized membrane protein YeiB
MAMITRVAEWAGGVLISSVLSVVGAVALGAWAARHRLLDEPARHRRLLGRVAIVGMVTAVLAGLPLASAAVDVWSPGAGALALAGALHALGGYAGGLGYAAGFGLLAARSRARDRDPAAANRRPAHPSEPLRRECRASEADRAGAARPGPVVRALAACGQRSLSCYLGQSVVFVALLPAWTVGLGARLTVAQAALLDIVVWLGLLLLAAAAARAGYRGPAEVLLRRLTYGSAAPRR